MQDLALPRRHHIVLANLDAFVQNWVRVTIALDSQDWQVKAIEYYDTEGHARLGLHVGFQTEQDFDSLPASAKLGIYGRLNQWQHERRQAAHTKAVEASRAVAS